MLAALRQVRYPIETALLLVLCFFLPLFEAPKNIAFLAYVVTWAVNRARSRDFGGRWDLWDTLIALWIASGYLAAAFAGLHGNEWIGARDLHRYAMVLWLAKRGGYSPREIQWILGTLVASTVIGIAYGYWRMWSGEGKSGMLQLHSVGHVNHTAIYIAIVLGLWAAWLYSCWQAWRPGTRAVGVAVSTLFVVALMETASRAAIGVGLALLPALALLWWRRWRFLLPASVIVVAAIITLGIFGGVEVVQKQQRDVTQQNVLAFRDGVWRMGFAAWERFPLFGVGMDNFSLITHTRVKAWRAESGKEYEADRYVQFPHGHSLYVNTLAERGTVGFAMFAAVLLAWLLWLARFRPRAQDADIDWILWGGAAGAWFVTAAAGSVNTTLHDEHGILAVLLLGLWLSRRRAPAS
jgi:O-antigen ligase